MSCRHCEERSDDAIQLFLLRRKKLDCFASLAMTGEWPAGAAASRYLDLLPHRRADHLDATGADQMRELDHRAVGTGLRQADAVLAADHLDAGKVRPRRIGQRV